MTSSSYRRTGYGGVLTERGYVHRRAPPTEAGRSPSSGTFRPRRHRPPRHSLLEVLSQAPPSKPQSESAAPGAEGGPAEWRMSWHGLDAALHRLAPAVDSRPVLLAWDLNQTLSGRNVGFTGGRKGLEGVLSQHHLVAYTAEQPSSLPDCRSVDHVCGPALRQRGSTPPSVVSGLGSGWREQLARARCSSRGRRRAAAAAGSS